MNRDLIPFLAVMTYGLLVAGSAVYAAMRAGPLWAIMVPSLIWLTAASVTSMAVTSEYRARRRDRLSRRSTRRKN